MGNKRSHIPGLSDKEVGKFENITFFTAIEIRKLHKRYRKYSSFDGRLTRIQFMNMFSALKENEEAMLIVEHIFRVCDEDGDETLNFGEFITSMSVTVRGTTRQRIEWLFHLYDINKDGSVDITEIQEVMKAFMKKRELNDLHRMFKEIDKNGDGVLTKDEFVEGCMKDNALMEYLGIC